MKQAGSTKKDAQIAHRRDNVNQLYSNYDVVANLMCELMNEIASCLQSEANATSGRMTVFFHGTARHGGCTFLTGRIFLSVAITFFVLLLKGATAFKT